jgi:very-short-patch-repair endonuclease
MKNNKTKNKILLRLFEQYIRGRYSVRKEVVFSHIMDTKRKFRADYLLDEKIIIEINGGQFINGRHNRGGKGYENDLTKLNLAQSNGFKVFQFTYEMLSRKEFVIYL